MLIYFLNVRRAIIGSCTADNELFSLPFYFHFLKIFTKLINFVSFTLSVRIQSVTSSPCKKTKPSKKSETVLVRRIQHKTLVQLFISISICAIEVNRKRKCNFTLCWSRETDFSSYSCRWRCRFFNIRFCLRTQIDNSIHILNPRAHLQCKQS